MVSEVQVGASSPQGVEMGRGLAWIGDGFKMFGKAPGAWIAITIIYLVISLVLSFIPFIGSLALILLAPIFLGGLMLGCRKQDQGGALEVGDLFAGFSGKGGALAIVGALYLVGMIVVMVVGAILMAVLGGGAAAFGALSGDSGSAAGLGLGMLLMGLVMVALIMPVIMAYWFAPALVVLDDLSPVDAMKQSFAGCMKNIGPFLIYGLITFVLVLVCMIPLGLGLLVSTPVLFASIYLGYKDIFKSA